MADYIEREAVCPYCPSYEECKGECWSEGECEIYDILVQVPAADVVPVVRCKDCIRCGFCGDATSLEVMGFYGYCSRGKRREGDGNG